MRNLRITLQPGDTLHVTVPDAVPPPSQPPPPGVPAGPAPPVPGHPPTVFAPYTDVTLWPTPRLADLLDQTGAARLTLAFVVNDSENRLSWGGVQPWNWTDLWQQVHDVGADRFVCSVGGAAGVDPCVGNPNVGDLFQQFSDLIHTFGFDTLDFDVEGAAVADVESVQRRNRLIRSLNVAFPNLKIHFTLPVSRSGLDAACVALLRDAVGQKCVVHVVNLMTMDYGVGVSDMGDAALQALKASEDQIRAAGMVPRSGLGVCPMIGQNDTAGLCGRQPLGDLADVLVHRQGQRPAQRTRQIVRGAAGRFCVQPDLFGRPDL